MEYIKKEELIIGEIYNCANIRGSKYIVKIPNDLYNSTNINKDIPRLYKMGNFTTETLQWSLATSEEKHWLESCVKLDKFITFEEATKTFIPEYVEWIDNIGSGNLGHQTKDHFKKNKIFKTDVELPSHGFQTQNWIKHLEIYANNYKPSTKEAYDAQFVVKEPEFVLPEKWCVKTTLSNKNILQDYLQNNIINYPEYLKTWEVVNDRYFHNKGHDYGGGHSSYKIFDGFIEITFEQFKKYVLKEEIVEEKVIEPLPQFKVIESIETITKVENNEGNQFFIGDKVITPLNNIIRIISSFTYNQDKTELYANFKETLDVININKIEHYIEPKVEFILPEKWGILRTNDNDKIITDYINKQYNYNHSYLFHNKHNPYLHNKIGWSSNYKLFKDHVEITFDQFQKYVLKTEVKEESLLEKAKRLYPVGTRYTPEPNNAYFNRIQSSTAIFEVRNQGIFCKNNLGWVFYKNKWAEIIEYYE